MLRLKQQVQILRLKQQVQILRLKQRVARVMQMMETQMGRIRQPQM